MASLEMPSASRLDLTPSPVPRVALSPATGAVDISLVPGPHASRNLPTLAAHHVLGRRPARRPASAITFPPHHSERRGTAESPRLGALAKDVRSSKREIVLGLAIGLGLSLVLAAVGQAYLRDDEPVASSPPPEVESLALSARPEPATPPPSAVGDEPASSEETAAKPIARAALAERTAMSPRVMSSPAVSSPAARAHQRRAGQVGNGLDEPERLATAPAQPSSPGPVARRAHHDGASPVPSRASTSPAQASGKTSDSSRGYGTPAPARAPQAPAALNPASLSPAESAGLGLDLPL